MAGPAQSGVLIYSNNISRLAEFYQQLFAMQLIRQTSDFISLDTNGFNLVIHVPPFELPVPVFSPVKLFLTVEHMATARAAALRLGGQAFDGEWSNPLFSVSNIADCDGNHIQLRQFKQ